MTAPPNMRAPALAGAGDAEVDKAGERAEIYQNRPDNATADIAIAEAARYVYGAAWRLRGAVWRLDESGFRCRDLEDLAADAGALLARWAGRHVPDDRPRVPLHIVASARAWRRQHGRTY